MNLYNKKGKIVEKNEIKIEFINKYTIGLKKFERLHYFFINFMTHLFQI